MKKQVLVVTGLLILASVCVVWVYLLIFGVPKDSSDIFSDFGFPTESSQETPINNTTNEVFEGNTIDISSTEKLSQLTIRPVAGWQSIIVSTTTEKLIYAEQGTGHIYEININTGEESRIDGTTIPGTQSVFFSTNGKSAVFISEASGVLINILRLEDSTQIELPTGSDNFQFLGNSTLLYTVTNAAGSTGYSYNTESEVHTELFNTPFGEISVIWTDTGNYLYNKPSPHLEGSLYQAAGTNLKSILPSQYNLTAFSNLAGDTFLYTAVDILDQQLRTKALRNGSIREVPILGVKDKCVFSDDDNNIVWCGSPQETMGDKDELSNWYKGVQQFSDNLWEIDLSTQTGSFLLNFTKFSGREIDIDKIQVNVTENRLYFRNKIDNTLWLFNL